MNKNIYRGSDSSYSVNKRYFLYCYKDLSVAIFKQSINNSISVFNHSHPEYEFLIPITAVPYLSYEGSMFLGESGMVYPVQSGRVHGVSYTVENISYIHITVSKDFLETTIEKLYGLETKEFNYEFEATSRLNILIDLFKIEASVALTCEETLNHLAALICIELAICGLSSRKITKHNTKYPTIRTIKETADYIINNLSTNICIDDLASLCNLSRFHYIRLFKQCLGETPYSYLIKARLSKAKLLLANTKLSITEVGLRCGFSSPNRFSEVFKEKNKTSPTSYRKLHLH